MRIAIHNPHYIEGFCGVYIKIPGWFAEENNVDFHEATITRQSEKAILIAHKQVELWIPRSLITVHNVPKGLEDWK
ncbi:MAG TPA: hypothetical protein VJ044_18605 [Candidatus Hodarchaeales archaeon]|nr:hypothetical protein [Candidatus Hodarchaeales archaeon]